MFHARLLFACAAAVSVFAIAGCSSGARVGMEDETQSEGASALETSCPAGVTSHQVLVTLDEASGLRCRAIMGSYLSLSWEGHEYIKWVADEPSPCHHEVDAMRRAGGVNQTLRGVVVERCSTLVDGRRVFTRDLVLENRWALTYVGPS